MPAEAFLTIVALVFAFVGTGVWALWLKMDKDDLSERVDDLKQRLARCKEELSYTERTLSEERRELRKTREELADIKKNGPKLEIHQVNFDAVPIYETTQIHYSGPGIEPAMLERIRKDAIQQCWMKLFYLAQPYIEVRNGEEWEKIGRVAAKTVDKTTGATSQAITIKLLVGVRR